MVCLGNMFMDTVHKGDNDDDDDDDDDDDNNNNNYYYYWHIKVKKIQYGGVIFKINLMEISVWAWTGFIWSFV